MGKYISLSFACLTLSLMPLCLEAQDLVILHTNDMHSQIEPASDPDGNSSGGFQAVADYIKTVRRDCRNVLVLDCGDYNQGTPYFNIFKGDLEVSLLNAMGYDVAAIGNHEFDNGHADFARRLKKARYETVCANYDFSGTPLENVIKPYTIVKKGEYRIGIIGALTNLGGLVMAKNISGMKYLENTEEIIDGYAKMLKEEKHCDLVIVISHLGYDGSPDRPSDIRLAERTRYVDIVIGGHSHTEMQEPDVRINAAGREVPVVQAGSKTRFVGRLDVSL